MAVVPKELEEQLSKGLLVLSSKTDEGIKIIIEGANNAVRGCFLLVRSSLEARQNGRIPRLQEIDNQTDPRIRTQGASKS